VIKRVLASVTVVYVAWDRLYLCCTVPHVITAFVCTMQCKARVGSPTVPFHEWFLCCFLYVLVLLLAAFALELWHLPFLVLLLLLTSTYYIARPSYKPELWEEEEELEEWTTLETLDWIDELLVDISEILDIVSSSVEKLQLVFCWADSIVTSLVFCVLAVAASCCALIIYSLLAISESEVGSVIFLLGTPFLLSSVHTACIYYWDASDGTNILTAQDADLKQLLWFDFHLGGRDKLIARHHQVFHAMCRHASIRKWEGYTRRSASADTPSLPPPPCALALTLMLPASCSHH
jgi:hypothetical protein